MKYFLCDISFMNCTLMQQKEREEAGFHDSFVILRPVFVIRRYCSGLYNVAISYIGTPGRVEPSVHYQEAVAVQFMVCIPIFLFLKNVMLL